VSPTLRRGAGPAGGSALSFRFPLVLSIGIVSLLLGGLLALNGYLAIRNYAFTFFGQLPGSRAVQPCSADGQT